MKKRNIILLVVAVLTAMLFSSANSTLFAQEPETGKGEVVNLSFCGDSVYWNFIPDSGILIISGKGAMSNYPFPGTPTPWKRTGVDSLVIEEGVTEIGDYAFYYCEKIKSINLPNSLTRIGAFSFAGCSGLDSIDIPASVRSIEHSAFCYCRNIQNLNIQSDSIDIAPFAFGFCDKLQKNTFSYMAEGRKISSCAFYKMLDSEEQKSDSAAVEQTDSMLESSQENRDY